MESMRGRNLVRVGRWLSGLCDSSPTDLRECQRRGQMATPRPAGAESHYEFTSHTTIPVLIENLSTGAFKAEKTPRGYHRLAFFRNRILFFVGARNLKPS
jgi:hypothetical protein